MNYHELLERFLSSTVGQKVLMAAGFLLIFFCLNFALLALGRKIERARIDRAASAEKTRMQTAINDSDIREKSLRQDAEKLIIENEILRFSNEAKEKILLEQGKKTELEKVSKINNLTEGINKKYEEISNSGDDVHLQRRFLCDEYLRSGYRLSAEFCGKTND